MKTYIVPIDGEVPENLLAVFTRLNERGEVNVVLKPVTTDKLTDFEKKSQEVLQKALTVADVDKPQLAVDNYVLEILRQLYTQVDESIADVPPHIITSLSDLLGSDVAYIPLGIYHPHGDLFALAVVSDILRDTYTYTPDLKTSFRITKARTSQTLQTLAIASDVFMHALLEYRETHSVASTIATGASNPKLLVAFHRLYKALSTIYPHATPQQLFRL